MKRIIRDEDLENVYTAKTLSKEFNVSERQIHYYREHNQLESVNKGRARFIYPKQSVICLLYTSPSPRDRQKSRMPSSA